MAIAISRDRAKRESATPCAVRRRLPRVVPQSRLSKRRRRHSQIPTASSRRRSICAATLVHTGLARRSIGGAGPAAHPSAHDVSSGLCQLEIPYKLRTLATASKLDFPRVRRAASSPHLHGGQIAGAENGLSREDHDQDDILGPRSQRRSRTIRNKPAALERLRRERRASTARSLRSKGSEVPACSCTKESRCSE
jgi:hypothetical protein